MSRIEELLQELCPNGVEYKKLQNLAEISTGSSNTNEAVDNGKYPFFVRSQELSYKDDYEFDETAIITAGDGVGVGKVLHFYSGKYSLHQRAYRIHITKEKLLPKFFYYFMQSTFYEYITKAGFHSSVSSIRRPMLNNYLVPVPPLEVQREIVHILDSYSASVTALQQELTAELALRKKQYEYYRDKLLDFGKASKCEWKTVGEVCNISAGGDVPKENLSQNKTSVYNIPIISNGIGEGAFYGYTNIIKISEPAVTIAARGTIGYAEYRDYPYYPIIRLLSIIPKSTDLLNTKYLYYVLKKQHYNVPKTGIPQLTSPMIKKITIPIPSIEEQQRIVNILDRFEKLCNDISEGLPAEIESRQKQYEYYRDKLLSFKELKT